MIFSQWKEIKLKNFEKIKVVKIYVRGITILLREDSVMEKGLKKLIKGQCPLRDIATAWELRVKFFLRQIKDSCSF